MLYGFDDIKNHTKLLSAKDIEVVSIEKNLVDEVW
jgi:hypothetical protein